MFRSRKKRSIRLKNYDYGSNGRYFITICVKQMVQIFGEVVNAEMILSDIGVIVREELFKIEDKSKGIFLGVNQIMPNHVHLILGIYRKNNCINFCDNINKFPYVSPKSNSVPSIIRDFKSKVTRRCHKNGFIEGRVWQYRFYDRIIRDQREYLQIKEYIMNNPSKWQEDRFWG